MLAFRLSLDRRPREGHSVAVVELAEDYVPRGSMTVIKPQDVR